MERLDIIAAHIGETAARMEQCKQSAMREMRNLDKVRRWFSDAVENYLNSLEGLQGMTDGAETQERCRQVAMRELKNLNDARKKYVDAYVMHRQSLEKLESLTEIYEEDIRKYSKSFNPKEFPCATEEDLYKFYCLSIVAAYEGDAIIPQAKAGSEWFKHVKGLKLRAKLLRPSGERVRVVHQLSSSSQPTTDLQSLPRKRNSVDAGH